MTPDFEQVKEALASMILPYIAERTSLSTADIERVLEAEMEFWMAHPNGVRLIFGEDCEDAG
jgi:hypothetical protein